MIENGRGCKMRIKAEEGKEVENGREKKQIRNKRQ